MHTASEAQVEFEPTTVSSTKCVSVQAVRNHSATGIGSVVRDIMGVSFVTFGRLMPLQGCIYPFL